uniref:Folylpolyglutamate synthase n=1 Tax=Hanusia phi TaxID=3032 RepID=A0A7S0HY33_9CRYP
MPRNHDGICSSALRCLSSGTSDDNEMRDRADNMVASSEWNRTKDALLKLITKRTRERLRTDAVEATREHLEQLHLDLSRLSVIHVAGTKGKGSTCSMVESILRSKGYRTGLYTSPHLIDVRERVRINGDPLSHDKFCRYFWEVHHALKMFSDDEQNDSQMPGYFRFLTVLAFKIFLSEPIDVAIVEVGLGGRFDATNVVSPVVCGITSLGFDHTNVLGNTIEEIAFQKAGILKPGVLSFTSPQRPNAMQVLEEQARQVGCPLLQAPPMSQCAQRDEVKASDIGLKGQVQDINAGLAVALSNAWLARNQAGPAKKEDLFVVSEGFREGLRSVKMLGRCQRLVFAPRSKFSTRNLEMSYYLDGAHTLESVECGARWYGSHVDTAQRNDVKQVANILVFYCSGDRDYKSLLAPLFELHRSHPFTKVLFCPNNEAMDTKGMTISSWTQLIAAHWEEETGRATEILENVNALVNALSAEANETLGLAKDSAWDLKANGDQLFAPHEAEEAEERSRAMVSKQEFNVYITGSLLLCGDTLEELLSRSLKPYEAKEWILKYSK